MDLQINLKTCLEVNSDDKLEVLFLDIYMPITKKGLKKKKIKWEKSKQKNHTRKKIYMTQQKQ